MTDFIKSPEGKIQFLALKRKVKNKPSDTEPSVYTVRLEFDGTTAEGKAWRKKIEAINSGIIGTKSVTSPDNFTVKASTKYEVKVFNKYGDLLTEEEIPFFGKDSEGTAKMVVKPYTGNSLGGSINLISVQLVDIEAGEQAAGDTDSLVDKLRDMLQ